MINYLQGHPDIAAQYHYGGEVWDRLIAGLHCETRMQSAQLVDGEALGACRDCRAAAYARAKAAHVRWIAVVRAAIARNPAEAVMVEWN